MPVSIMRSLLIIAVVSVQGTEPSLQIQCPARQTESAPPPLRQSQSLTPNTPDPATRLQTDFYDIYGKCASYILWPFPLGKVWPHGQKKALYDFFADR